MPVCFFVLAGRLFDFPIKLLQKQTFESSSSGLFSNLVTWSVSLIDFYHYIIMSVAEISSLICFDFPLTGFWYGLTFRFFSGGVLSFSTRAFPFPSTSTTLLWGLGAAHCANSMSMIPSDSSLKTVLWRNCNFSKYLETGNFDDPVPDLCFNWRFQIHLL